MDSYHVKVSTCYDDVNLGLIKSIMQERKNYWDGSHGFFILYFDNLTNTAFVLGSLCPSLNFDTSLEGTKDGEAEGDGCT